MKDKNYEIYKFNRKNDKIEYYFLNEKIHMN